MAVALDEEVQLHLALRDEVGRSFVSSRDLFDAAANGGKGFSTVVRSKTDGVRAMSTERLALPSLEVDVFMRDETTLDEPTLVVLGAFHLADLSRDDVWCGSMLNIWSRVSNLDVHRAVDREQWLLARFQRDRRTEIMSVFLSAVLHFGGWLYISYLDGELKRLLRRNLFPFIGPLPQIPAVVLRDGGAAGRWIREVGLECLQKDVILAMLSYIAQHNSSRRAATAGAPRVWNVIMARGRLPLASREEIARQLTLRYDYPRRVAADFARRAHESELSRRRRWPAPWEEAAVAADAARRLAQQLAQAPAPAPAASRRARRARRPAARGPRQATLRDYLIASPGGVRPRMPRGRTVAAAPAPSASEALEAQRRELAAHNERQIARDEAYARRIYEAEASAAVAPNAPAPARERSPPPRTRPRPAATPTPNRQRRRTGSRSPNRGG
ncbi:unnamed protein product [Pelagomonas calceolata]|uniref:Uncharacterized protein n=1 Tax=Pelagomonas calceolata TaxID=35677 RepID=A0A8J2S5C5_9STRA|nr:unnamed protein product [Pelagomonas calceolata]